MIIDIKIKYYRWTWKINCLIGNYLLRKRYDIIFSILYSNKSDPGINNTYLALKTWGRSASGSLATGWFPAGVEATGFSVDGLISHKLLKLDEFIRSGIVKNLIPSIILQNISFHADNSYRTTHNNSSKESRCDSWEKWGDTAVDEWRERDDWGFKHALARNRWRPISLNKIFNTPSNNALAAPQFSRFITR